LPATKPLWYKGTVGRKGLAVLLAVLAVVLRLLAGPALAQNTEADVYVAQAILDFDDKRYAEALESLRRALELEPDNVDALYYTGVVHMAQDRPTQAIPFLERAREKAPGSLPVAFQLGMAHYAAQVYDRAQPLLEQVFRADPSQDGLGYYVGFLRYRQKDYRGALAAFRAARSSDPEVRQLTEFYTGLTLAAMGLPAQAAAQVEAGLRAAPGSPLTGPAERLRDSILAAQQAERRFSAEVRFGFFYDDNVAVIPSGSSREPLVRALREPDSDSTGELIGVRLDYVWLRQDDWESTLGYTFFGTYNNDLPSLNISDHEFRLTLTRGFVVGSMPARAGAQFAWDVLFLDDDEFLKRATLTLFGTLVESEDHLSQVVLRYQRKDFHEENPRPPGAEFRDADNFMAGLVHVLRFAQDRHFLKAGYQFDYEATRGSNYAYHGHRVLAGGQYTLPWQGVRLRYDIDVHFRDYEHRNTLLPTTAPGTTRRHDKEITNLVRAEWPLPWRVAIPVLGGDSGFTLAAEYLSTVNISSLAPFEYSRNVFSLSLSWNY
jgi:tetratricopeptide (TPR) repeat protein